MEGNLRKRSLALQARVQRSRGPAFWHPPTGSIREGQWIEARSRSSEDFSTEYFTRKATQPICQIWIVDHLAACLHVHAVSELINYSYDLAGSTFLQQLRGYRTLQQLLAGKQPQPGVMRFVEV